MNTQSCETYPQIHTEYSAMEKMVDMMVDIRNSLSNKISEIGDDSFTVEPKVNMNTDVLVSRQIDDLVFVLTLSPRIACEKIRHNGENSLVALRPPYISVYGAYYNVDDYFGDMIGRIAHATTNSVGYTGKKAVFNAVGYAMSLLSSNWSRHVRQLKPLL